MNHRTSRVIDRLAGLLASKATADACGMCVTEFGAYVQHRCVLGQLQQRRANVWCHGCGWQWSPWRIVGRCHN
jgi:hypothetical protein